MIISHKHKFIFIKTGKTAGTSIETYLSPYCGTEDVLTPFGIAESGHLPRNFKRFKNHLPGHEIREAVPTNIWSSYYKFCVERNPWDKSLSHYFFTIGRHGLTLSFNQYLDQGYSCVNYPKYTEPGDPDHLIVDRVIMYENLEKELGEVLGKLGIPFDSGLKIRAKGNYRSDRRHYSEVLTPTQKDILCKTYAQEIKLFNFKY